MIDQHKVLDSLRELSDGDLQRRIWLETSGPEVSSFPEAVCQLFDDTGLGDALEKGSTVFSEQADRTLKELRRAASTMVSSLPPQSLIEHPQMPSIRRLASRAIEEISAAASS